MRRSQQEGDSFQSALVLKHVALSAVGGYSLYSDTTSHIFPKLYNICGFILFHVHFLKTPKESKKRCASIFKLSCHGGQGCSLVAEHLLLWQVQSSSNPFQEFQILDYFQKRVFSAQDLDKTNLRLLSRYKA